MFHRSAARLLTLPRGSLQMTKSIASLSASLLHSAPLTHQCTSRVPLVATNSTLLHQLIRSMSTKVKARASSSRKTPYRDLVDASNSEVPYKLTEPYEEGTVTLYRSPKPRAMRYMFALLAFILLSHYAMIPELAKADTFNMGLPGWIAAASVETGILVGVLHMFARRYIRSISCNIVNPLAFPDSLTFTVSNFMGNPQQVIIPVRQIVGFTALSRPTAHKDVLVHLEISGLNNNMYFMRKGWYHENTQILDSVFNYNIEDLTKEQ